MTNQEASWMPEANDIKTEGNSCLMYSGTDKTKAVKFGDAENIVSEHYSAVTKM